MISPTSFGSPQVDPNSLRAIEQISHVINDIEQRLQIVRVALAQSVPSMPFGTNPLASLGTTTPWGHLSPTLSGSPVNPLALQQLQHLQQIQQLMALNPLVGSPYSGVPSSLPFGSSFGAGFPTTFPGVGSPFGTATPFGASPTPFRF